jgi:hypothetical protein
MEGVDLSGLAKGSGVHPRSFPVAYAELGPEIFALQTPRWKYIHNPKQYRSPGAKKKGSGYYPFFRIEIDELYDLAADPGEQSNVATQHPSVVEALRERLLAWRENGEDARASGKMTPESRAELKALGYLE